jgi:hypothetical protein
MIYVISYPFSLFPSFPVYTQGRTPIPCPFPPNGGRGRRSVGAQYIVPLHRVQGMGGATCPPLNPYMEVKGVGSLRSFEDSTSFRQRVVSFYRAQILKESIEILLIQPAVISSERQPDRRRGSQVHSNRNRRRSTCLQSRHGHGNPANRHGKSPNRGCWRAM